MSTRNKIVHKKCDPDVVNIGRRAASRWGCGDSLGLFFSLLLQGILDGLGGLVSKMQLPFRPVPATLFARANTLATMRKLLIAL